MMCRYALFLCGWIAAAGGGIERPVQAGEERPAKSLLPRFGWDVKSLLPAKSPQDANKEANKNASPESAKSSPKDGEKAKTRNEATQGAVLQAGAQVEAGDLDDGEWIRQYPNLPLKTLGGRQFWGDVHYFRKWRIQQHIIDKHYRLIDAHDVRHAWGSLDQCRAKLAEIRKQQKLAPMSGEAVLVIHGIVRSSKQCMALTQHLEKQGYVAIGFDYPSTHADLPACADYLHQLIQSLDGIEKIHFVTHSMGGLVVRTYLSKHEDPRLGRFVMLGTPNLGAELADKFHTNPVFKVVFGPAGQQLARKSTTFVDELPIPQLEFGIIAGGTGTLDGYNPLIPGDDDGIVSVSSTRLPGAKDFVILKTPHRGLVQHELSLEYCTRFLKEARFRDIGNPSPIPTED